MYTYVELLFTLEDIFYWCVPNEKILNIKLSQMYFVTEVDIRKLQKQNLKPIKHIFLNDFFKLILRV